MSWEVRPVALVVFGKSNAMRGGLLTVKPAGGLATGDLIVILTTTVPPDCGETATDSMLFCA